MTPGKGHTCRMVLEEGLRPAGLFVQARTCWTLTLCHQRSQWPVLNALPQGLLLQRKRQRQVSSLHACIVQ